ncbi:MAG: type 1 glutamine amidotransferase [Paracoccaceae bacterium]
MIIGILETGKMADHLADAHGQYPYLFRSLFQSVEQTIEMPFWEVVYGELPERPDVCDAWLITGSRYGVYDDEPWIEPLKGFLRDVRDSTIPIIGICFGHQIMAEAFGGRAEKSEKGWGCGVHTYDWVAKPSWITDQATSFSMHAMHQDQVTRLPEDAVTLASSAFCKHALVAYGELECPYAISVQAHPEFSASLGEVLVRFRRSSHIPEDVADHALQTFGDPVQRESFVQCALEIVRRSERRRQAA